MNEKSEEQEGERKSSDTRVQVLEWERKGIG